MNQSRLFIFTALIVAVLALAASAPSAWSAPSNSAGATPRMPVALNGDLEIRFVMDTTNATGAKSLRIAKDPRDNQLYYLKRNGDIYRVDLVATGAATSFRLYSANDHGIATDAQGMTIGSDGTIYLIGNLKTNNGNSTVARIMKGVPDETGQRAWSLLAQTEPYPLGGTGFDHLCNGLVLSPDGNSIYVNSGARTDHGEVQANNGLYPGTRDVALTAKILCVPTSASNLVLLNDADFLRSAGYLFAEGTRNAYDLAFAPNGDLFCADNGPDRDMSDELNWLRRGFHYGFPWRMGNADNPQQFTDYNPAIDLLLNPAYSAVRDGYYHNDPTFPPAPGGFADPVINLGPDADSFRDPVDGQIKRAAVLGETLSTVTAHRSPLGLVFDTAGALAAPFRHHGFLLSWMPNPLGDPSQDMLDVDLTKLGETNYQANLTRIVEGFSNPIDAEIVSNRVYVLEYGANQSIWEITFPAATVTEANSEPVLPQQTNRIIAELTLLIVTNTATDSEIPAGVLSYELLGPPNGAMIDAAGVITWIPSEEQGPGTYELTTVVSDGLLSATNSFSVMVTEVNSEPPVITAVSRGIAGQCQFTISGSRGDVYRVESSTNLISWEVIGTLTNFTGTIQFQDLEATNFSQRFYRVLVP
jgi:glucose/arabinose dehydrogenase